MQREREHHVVEQRVSDSFADSLKLPDERLASWTASTGYHDLSEERPHLEWTAVGQRLQHRRCVACPRHDCNPMAHGIQKSFLTSRFVASTSELERGSNQVVNDEKCDQAENGKPKPHPCGGRRSEGDCDTGGNPRRHRYGCETRLGERDPNRFWPYPSAHATPRRPI